MMSTHCSLARSKINVVYKAKCGQRGEQYVGATQRPLSKRVHQQHRLEA